MFVKSAVKARGARFFFAGLVVFGALKPFSDDVSCTKMEWANSMWVEISLGNR